LEATVKLTDPIFTDEAKARAYFEAIRWPNGPVCPHCGTTNKVYLLKGKSTRPGLYHCNVCEGSFTVKTGGVMESSKIPLNKWALAFYLYASSKKGFSAHQLGRQLGITYKSAWFMSHRIREAMTPAAGQELRLGGPGKVVEADETELAPSRKSRSKVIVDGYRDRGRYKRFVSLIERNGAVRSHVITGREMSPVRKAVRATIKPGTVLHTDGGTAYKNILPVGWHESVDHNKQYAKDGLAERVHVNTAEGYFSLFKRGLVGTYQHMDERHLPRYLAEFDFRMSNRVALGVNDEVRTERAIKGAEGKRLTYHQSDKQGQV
jgi:transposase-like protein